MIKDYVAFAGCEATLCVRYEKSTERFAPVLPVCQRAECGSKLESSRPPNPSRQAAPATVNLVLLLPLVVHHHNRLLHQCTKSFMAVLDGEYLCLCDD
jgi:hypothetical protein